jgi:hypothetical protein
MTAEGVHGGVEVVFVRVFVGRETAGGGEQRALCSVFEGEFRTREEEESEDHGREKSALAGSAYVDEDEVQMQGFPGIDEDGETAKIEGGVEEKNLTLLKRL